MMEPVELSKLYDAYHRQLARTDTKLVRYLYDRINWNSRIIGIMGARGVGKTTILLQRILLTFKNPDETLYVSLDDIWFSDHSLSDLVEHLYSHGIMTLFVDEVHHYNRWQQTFKNIYDQFPDFKIVYTSSCLLEIDNSKYDLSRRQVIYELEPMSFREFLKMEKLLDIEAQTLEVLLADHVKIAMEICGKIKIIPAFSRYLMYGCYPFYSEGLEDFQIKLRESVITVVERDIAVTGQFEYKTLVKIKKLLSIIAGMVPFVPNMKVLFEQIETDRNLGLKMLYTLNKAKLLNLILTEKESYKNLVKPEKILLGDPNLMYALCSVVETGTVRETFFANQMAAAGHIVIASSIGDFKIDGKQIFEIRGKDKSFKQIKDVPDSYLAVADMEIGFGNRIPLWMFGLLY